MEETQLRTIWQQRQFNDRAAPLSRPLGMFMKYKLAKKVRQLSKLCDIWDALIPDEINDHTALESFNRGVLTVTVDSSPHRYNLQMLLSGGLMRELQARFDGAVNKVRLIPGQFSSVDLSGARRYEF